MHDIFTNYSRSSFQNATELPFVDAWGCLGSPVATGPNLKPAMKTACGNIHQTPNWSFTLFPSVSKNAGNTRSIKSFCIANNPMFFQIRMSTFPKRIFSDGRFAITVPLKNWWDPEFDLDQKHVQFQENIHGIFWVRFKAGGHKETGSHSDGLVEGSSFSKISPFFLKPSIIC